MPLANARFRLIHALFRPGTPRSLQSPKKGLYVWPGDGIVTRNQRLTMKMIRPALIVPSLAAVILVFAGCNQSAGPTAQPSAVKNSFTEVTSKLDAGGNLYGYVSTEEWLSGLSQQVNSLRDLVGSLPNASDDDKKKIGAVFDVVTDMIKKSGIEDISGAGMSSIQKEKGIYHSKFILHHYPGKGSGMLWTAFGAKAHKLDGLDLLPSSTVIASFSDLDLGQIWMGLNTEIEKTGIPEIRQPMSQIPQQFAAVTGLPLDKVLGSLGNEYGLIITLDDNKKISLPFANPPIDLPEPGIMLAIKVKDDTIFNRVDELLKGNTQIVRDDKPDLKMRTMPVPMFTWLRPSIARSGEFLLIASSDGLIRDAIAVKGGKPGLKSGEEFKRLATGEPTEGNSFSFVSARFMRTWKPLQVQFMHINAGGDGDNAGQAFVKKLMDLQSGDPFSYGVSANTDEGWMFTGNGNQNPAKVLLIPAVVVPAVVAGMTLPALTKAKEKAQRINCINNLRQIQLAKQMWASDDNKKAGDVPTWKDLKQYIGNSSGMFTCPSGGTYQINGVGEAPTCSIPGHALPQ